jgi:hypothetical protein
MKLTLKGSIAALVLAPAALLSEHAALADDASREPVPVLSRSIRLLNDGRYAQDVCDHAAPRHCLAQRLLPQTFRPQDARLQQFPGQPGFGGQICNGGGGFGGSSPPENAMTPSDVVEAYQIPAASSAGGRIVALVDMPDSNAFDEVNTYRQAFGIPALPKCAGGLPDGKTPCFAAVDEHGSPDSSLDCPAGDGETGLDMAMVSAACPDCSILLVQMTEAQQGPQDQDFVTCSATAAKLGAVATSISFGGPEQGSDPTGYTTPGHLVVAASGDAGYLLEGMTNEGGGQSPSYPASAPDVLSVGGTILQKSEDGYSEVVWNDRSGATSSGCSTEFAMPAFQTQFGASHFGSCAKRASTDVSAAATFVSGSGGGIAMYDAHDKWMPMVGTSASSPLVAAILTRVGLAAEIADDLGFLYKNMAAFNDVTSGTDDNKSLCQTGDVMCTAGPGWDGPTGVGTPNATKLAALDVTGSSSDAGSGSSSGGSSGSSSGSGSGSSSGSSSGTSSGSGDAGSGSAVDAGTSDDSGSSSSSGGSLDNSDTFGPSSSSNAGGCSLSGGPSGPRGGAALGLAIPGALAILASRRRRR